MMAPVVVGEPCVSQYAFELSSAITVHASAGFASVGTAALKSICKPVPGEPASGTQVGAGGVAMSG